jgi:hypothetical protein
MFIHLIDFERHMFNHTWMAFHPRKIINYKYIFYTKENLELKATSYEKWCHDKNQQIWLNLYVVYIKKTNSKINVPIVVTLWSFKRTLWN